MNERRQCKYKKPFERQRRHKRNMAAAETTPGELKTKSLFLVCKILVFKMSDVITIHLTLLLSLITLLDLYLQVKPCHQ